jgi:heme-degrading monooxygenase HmoA
MSKATDIGTFACQDGKAEEMEAVLTSMVETAKDEPGARSIRITAARGTPSGSSP